MAKTTTALGPLSKLLDGDTGQLLGIIDAEGRPFTPLPVLDFTAAQLSAMAAAGGLTRFATYIPSDADPPYQLWARSVSELVIVDGGAPYLGPQTMAQLQAGAYADGTPELAALAKDTTVYLTERGYAVTPSPDGTHWSSGASGDRYTPAELAALATPLRAGTLVADATGLIYGQSDGAGGYTDAASPPAFTLTAITNSFGTRRINIHGRDATLVRDGENQSSISSVFGNGETWNNVGLSATVSITASIAGTVMTVTAVGNATNPNGTSHAGAVNRGHYVSGDAGIPAGTHIIFVPSDTGDHGTGTYSLSADCGTIASTTLSLSCAAGVGGVVERQSDSFFGSASSADPDSTKVWRLSIKPTHRATLSHGRALLLGNALTARRRYRVEQLIRFADSSSCSWQRADTARALPGPMLIAGLEPGDIAGYDTTNSLGFGEQYVSNGSFVVTYSRGTLQAVMRTPNEDYAVKAADGFWSWTDKDRYNQFDQDAPLYYVKGQAPLKLVYELFADERMPSEGCKGWLKCWINDQLILDHKGPTLFPAGRLDGLVVPGAPRLGMYDVTYSAAMGVNDLCSTVKSTAEERWLHVKYWRQMEVA